VTVRSHELLAESESLPRHEAERLLAAATARSRSEVIVGFEVSDSEADIFRSYVQRRDRDEPLQYIEGTVPFGAVSINVDSRVLVPRPETEYLFEWLTERLVKPSVIIDLCTGSGNLALALKAAFPAASVHATDLSRAAVDVAISNAQRNDLDVSFHQGDLFDPLPRELKDRVDLLVANPPYLAESEMSDVPADVLMEPRGALVSGPRGDEIVRRIGAEASQWLAPGGLIACEVSEFHAGEVLEYFTDIEVSVVEDLTGRDRFVIGYRPVE
jgi:release factor glutamine methyltransferase